MPKMVLNITVNIINEETTKVFKRQPANFYLQQHLLMLGNSDTFLLVLFFNVELDNIFWIEK